MQGPDGENRGPFPTPLQTITSARNSRRDGSGTTRPANMADPYALNDDGTAKDPAAFRAALKADPAKLEAIQKEPEVADIVLGSDDHAFQELIKSVYHVSGWAEVHG